MKRYLTFLIAALALCVMVVAVGCGSDDSTTEGTSAQEGDDSSPATGDKVDLEKKTVGFVNVLGQSAAATRIQDAWVEAAEALGWEAKTIDGQGDPQKMTAGVQSFVDQKVDAIGTTAVDPAFAKSALDAAREAGIPTIQIGASMEQPWEYSASSEENDWAMGAMMSRYIATRIGYEGDIAVFNNPILFVFQARAAGRDAVLKSFPKIKVVATPEADLADPGGGAQADCARVVQANPSIKAIWLMIDAQTVGCIEGLRSQNKQDDVAVVGWYTNPDNVEALHNDKAGSAVVHAWLEEGAWQGIDAVAQFYATGKKIDPQSLAQQPTMQLFTAENIPEGTESAPPPVPFEEDFIDKWESEYNLP